MNIYARIRSIEDSQEFKRLVDTILGTEYGTEYQSVKEWRDFGIDGYHRTAQTVYALYCPRYPERRELEQYRVKIASDVAKLNAAVNNKKVKLGVKEWIFITPDDLPIEIVDLIQRKAAECGWKSGAITAQVLAPLFMKHPVMHMDFPMVTAGLQLDKVPGIDVRLAENRGYTMLELFNDGTGDIKNIDVSISEDKRNWRSMTDHFLFEYDDPMRGYGHSLYNLKKAERQYCNRVPTRGGFYYKISGVGVESSKTLIKEDFVAKVV